MKELDSFTVERLEELARAKMISGHDIADIRALARIALSAKQAVPIYQYQSGVCNDQFDGFDWVWDDCDKGFYGQYAADRRRIVYSTPQLNSPVIPEGWINCSDKMPESNEYKPIVIYTGNCLGQGMFVATYDEDGFFDFWEGSEITGVTYWMPLPAAPEKPL